MNLSNMIYSMYDKPFNNYILADCFLINDSITVIGNVLFKRDCSDIELLVKEFYHNELENNSSNRSHYKLHIESNSLPFYFYCEITNFPNDNRVIKFNNKDITLRFHKVRVGSDLLFTLNDQHSIVKCDIVPLYDSNGELGEMIIL